MKHKYLAPVILLSLLPSLETQAQIAYCDMPSYGYTEPICHVIFADIDNVSPGDLDAPDTEDFTNLTAHVVAGESYTITAYGNTGGDWANTIRVYFDWDRDGIFETAILIGEIEDSECDTPVSTTITVPANAQPGASRMRLLKKFLSSDPSPNDGCTAGSSFGQAEDYTVEVSVSIGIQEEDMPLATLFPNPATDGPVFIRLNKDLSGPLLEIHDLTGRLVHRKELTLAAGTTIPLPVEVLKAGQYFVSIRSDSGHWTERLVIH